MRIAIVGTGVSGLVAAHRLYPEHDVTIFEGDDRIGGHTHTVDVEEDGQTIAVDTGFIVFNESNYPRFTALLNELGVAYKPSDMSFSVHDERTGLEYRGSSLNTLFAQRRNLFRPAFYRMIRDIARFYREAPKETGTLDGREPLGSYLRRGGYSDLFIENHILPMVCALWSSDPEGAESMPLEFLVRFFSNHGMMQFRGRPDWQVVKGGSRGYVQALTLPLMDSIRVSSPIEAVRRRADGVDVKPAREEWLNFDRVILATHSDQALRILADADPAEREVLGAIRYQPNDVVLHTDTRLLPSRKRAWSSWNYHVLARRTGRPQVTYLMNMLQGLRTRRQYMVTLNRTEDIDPRSMLRQFVYDHPVFDLAAVEAQKRFHEINGVRNTYFCGAYWGYGFHEDGVRSAENAVESMLRMRRAA